MLFLRKCGFQPRPCSSGQEFLESLPHFLDGVLLVDLQMPVPDGLAILEHVREVKHRYPAIVMTGVGDIETAVRAMKLGAIDYFEKPCDGDQLLEAMTRAFQTVDDHAARRDQNDHAGELLKRLTPREREVLDALCEGLPNKLIAHRMKLSTRTIEMHRASMMARLEVRSLSEALRLAFLADERAIAA